MWRSRWRSLKLFTAGQYNGLPGMPFPADPDTYPGKDDVADFLRSYVEKFELPVRLSTTVTRLSAIGRPLSRGNDDRADRGRPSRRRHRPLPGPLHTQGRQRPRRWGNSASQR